MRNLVGSQQAWADGSRSSSSKLANFWNDSWRSIANRFPHVTWPRFPSIRKLSMVKRSCKIQENKIWVSSLNKPCPGFGFFLWKFAPVIGHNFGSSVTQTYLNNKWVAPPPPPPPFHTSFSFDNLINYAQCRPSVNLYQCQSLQLFSSFNKRIIAPFQS